MLSKALVCLLFVACASQVTAIGCTGVFNNRTYDLKSLISPSGSYVWKQDIYQTSGSLLYAPADYDKISVTFELQVCVPIQKSVSSNCTNSQSSVNMITPDGKCTSLGSGTVWKMYENPQNDGVYLSYDEGDKVTSVQAQSALVFFTCGAAVSNPVFEHQKPYFQSHFGFSTKVVC